MSKVTKRIGSVDEWKEAKKAAEVLGLELYEASFSGGWEDNEGEPFFASSGGGTDVEDIEVGYKYFEVPYNTPEGETKTAKIQPTRTFSQDAGTILMKFR